MSCSDQVENEMFWRWRSHDPETMRRWVIFAVEGGNILDAAVLGTVIADQAGAFPNCDPGGENAYSPSLGRRLLPRRHESYLVPVISIDTLCIECGTDSALLKIYVQGSGARAILLVSSTFRISTCILMYGWLGAVDFAIAARELPPEIGYAAVDLVPIYRDDMSHPRGYHGRNVLIVPRDQLPILTRRWK
jgi:hypothetical protein